jgi:hypothetical protein
MVCVMDLVEKMHAADAFRFSFDVDYYVGIGGLG